MGSPHAFERSRKMILSFFILHLQNIEKSKFSTLHWWSGPYKKNLTLLTSKCLLLIFLFMHLIFSSFLDLKNPHLILKFRTLKDILKVNFFKAFSNFFLLRKTVLPLPLSLPYFLTPIFNKNFILSNKNSPIFKNGSPRLRSNR